MPATATASPRMSMDQYNTLRKNAIIAQALRKKLPIFTSTFNPSNGNNIINIKPNNVGLITRFIVEVTATFAELTAGTTAVTKIGAANLLSNVQFTDLHQNLRINTHGFHLAVAASTKRRKPWGIATSFAQNMAWYEAPSFPITYATAPTTTATGTARCVFEVPVSVSATDLRGAVFAGLYQGQMNLQLTINPNAAPASGDDTWAVFYGADASSISSVTVNVYQEFWDQLPMDSNSGQYLLPPLDISKIYQLIAQNLTTMTPNTNFNIPFTNLRKYLSQSCLYNNSGTNGGLSANGTDINTWSLASASLVNIWQEAPPERKRVNREMFGTDVVDGLYCFPFYDRMIDTMQYGNMNLVLNPITAGASAYVNVMSEYFLEMQVASQAPSLPTNV